MKPINGDGQTSEALAEALETIVADADDEEAVTLGAARDRLKAALAEEGRDARPESTNGHSVYAELQALVEEYGEDAPAREFAAMKASESLSELIEELLDHTEDEESVTIGLVREAVKEAMTDPHAENVLVAELDALIERYGEDALAEDVLRSG
jgi:hypothetical protein